VNVSESNSIPASKHSNIEDFLADNKTQMEPLIRYLMTNYESLDETQQNFLNTLRGNDPNQVSDPLHTLQRMSVEELATAYDHLLSILLKRERLTI
jgi:formate dehydrogenase maturation protein FdhE